MHFVIWGHLRTFALRRLYQVMAHIFFFWQNLPFPNGWQTIQHPPVSSYKRIPPKEDKRGACTFPAQKSSGKGRQLSALYIDGSENHMALFILAKWPQMSLGHEVNCCWLSKKFITLCKRECHWVISVVEFLFLQGPHLASNSLSQHSPSCLKKCCLFIVRLLSKENRQRWRVWVGGQGPRGELF